MRAKNQLTLDMERLLNHREVSMQLYHPNSELQSSEIGVGVGLYSSGWVTH